MFPQRLVHPPRAKTKCNLILKTFNRITKHGERTRQQHRGVHRPKFTRVDTTNRKVLPTREQGQGTPQETALQRKTGVTVLWRTCGSKRTPSGTARGSRAGHRREKTSWRSREHNSTLTVHLCQCRSVRIRRAKARAKTAQGTSQDKWLRVLLW